MRIFRHASENFSVEIVEDNQGRMSQTYLAMPILRGASNNINRSEISSLIVFLETTLIQLSEKKEKEKNL